MEVKSKRAEKEKINLHVFGTSCLEKGGKRSRMWEISSRKSSEEKITTMTITMTISTTTAATTATTTTTTTTISTTTANDEKRGRKPLATATDAFGEKVPSFKLK
jgi:hypothetical protein